MMRHLLAGLTACALLAGGACAAPIKINGGLHQKTTVSAPPTTLGNWNAIGTAFTGDTSHMDISISHTISGATTLTQPSSGYIYTPETYPDVVFLKNTSGWNNGTADNTGRTSAVAHRTYVTNSGQGDAVAYNATAYVDSTRGGSTHFLANPAISLFNGDETAGAAGVYLNPYETVIHDNGFDVAGIGNVNNLDRTISTGAKNAVWLGYRVQSQGAAQIDAAYSAVGPMKVFIDATPTTLDGTTHAFIASTRNARWYGNAVAPGASGLFFTGLGTDYLVDDSSLGGWLLVVNSVQAFKVTDTLVTSPVPFRAKTYDSLNAVTSIVVGNAAQVGTGGTAACTAVRRCDSFSGDVTLTTGTGVPVAGNLFTVTFADTRTNPPNCVVGLYGGSTPLALSKGVSFNSLVFATLTALAASTSYSATYVCGGA